jgi:molybdopterin molybdotransferase
LRKSRFQGGVAADCGNQDSLEPIDDVLAGLLAVATPTRETELLPIGSVLGRVIDQDIVSQIPLPPFDNSAVDGYGIVASDIGRTAPGSLRLVFRIPAGSAATFTVGPGEAVRLLTGALVPDGVCAVVAEEHCHIGPNRVVIDQPVVDGANIRRGGEDVTRGSVVVEGGSVVDARHLAILAAAGCAIVPVRRRIRVALLSTGSELVEVSEELRSGMIHDINRPMLRAMLSKAWIDVKDFGICADEPVQLAQTLASATADSDIVVTSGGASGSDEDHIGAAIAGMGGEVWRHRLAIKPGKPLIVGRLDGRILLALPGNPVAAMVNFMLFGRPLLAAMTGTASTRPSGEAAVCAGPFAHFAGRTEFVPAAIVGRDNAGRSMVTKLGKGGSARLRPLVLADGLAEIPAKTGDLSAGSPVLFHPFRGETAI